MKPSVPKVSVIMATYNSAATVEKALLSIAAQTHPNLELIVMDGGSRDGTQAILERYGRHIAYWESKADNGVYHAWNKAFDHFTGDWFCFIGSDDYFTHPDVIAEAMAVDGLEDLQLVSGLINQVDGSGKVTRVIGEAWNWGALKRHHNIPHPGLLQRRSLFLKHGKFDERYRIAADYEYLLRFGPGVAARFMDVPFVDMGNQGMSRLQVGRVLRETYEIQKRHPDIGAAKARINYAIARSKHRLRRLLHKEY